MSAELRLAPAMCIYRGRGRPVNVEPSSPPNGRDGAAEESPDKVWRSTLDGSTTRIMKVISLCTAAQREILLHYCFERIHGYVSYYLRWGCMTRDSPLPEESGGVFDIIMNHLLQGQY